MMNLIGAGFTRISQFCFVQGGVPVVDESNEFQSRIVEIELTGRVHYRSVSLPAGTRILCATRVVLEGGGRNFLVCLVPDLLEGRREPDEAIWTQPPLVKVTIATLPAGQLLLPGYRFLGTAQLGSDLPADFRYVFAKMTTGVSFE